jgi:hypothetical protein
VGATPSEAPISDKKRTKAKWTDAVEEATAAEKDSIKFKSVKPKSGKSGKTAKSTVGMLLRRFRCFCSDWSFSGCTSSGP